MRRRRLPPGLLVAAALAAAGPALAQQGAPPDPDALIDRLRSIARESTGQAAPPSAEALVEQLRGTAADLPGETGEPLFTAATPELGEEEVRQRLTEAFGVEVLDMRVIQIEDNAAYVVKVMNPGGNSNAAFMVSELLVDGASGEVLGQLPDSARPRAADAAGEPLGELSSEGPEIRRRSHR